MSLLWDRKAAVTFGVKGEAGTKVTGLRITFSIEKTMESNANIAKITIFNLNETHRGILENEKDLLVILEVGYGNEISQLFIGDITKAASVNDGKNWITDILAGDGDQELKDATLDKSYKAGTSIKTVIDDSVKAIKDSGKIVDGVIQGIKDEVYQNGLSVSGLAKNILDDLVGKQGDLEWSIQDNEIQILPELEDTGELATVLSPQTGLIGSPIRREKGIEFAALIVTTKMRPGKVVKIESRDLSGLFKIRKAVYKGDTSAGEWSIKGVCDEKR